MPATVGASSKEITARESGKHAAARTDLRVRARRIGGEVLTGRRRDDAMLSVRAAVAVAIIVPSSVRAVVAVARTAPSDARVVAVAVTLVPLSARVTADAVGAVTCPQDGIAVSAMR